MLCRAVDLASLDGLDRVTFGRLAADTALRAGEDDAMAKVRRVVGASLPARR
ncbi:hypothetical protein ACFY4K_25970 [Streptomyces leeuwenhoekii]|uniref:hypothetical protein n=1 Tax=Streptomyces leeuwenhoekii TaxID=1437453 RepID=UPI00369A0981